jgi:Domain of unknown function (DUF5916)/Carbohydrate family 9 binding domain-like
MTLVNGQNTEKKRYTAAHINESPIIDGILNEKVWNEGEWTDDFTQFEPYNGRRASQQTEFKILFDDNNLFIAIKSFDTSPDSIVKRLTRRDHEDGDMVGIIFDSFHDLRTGFFFGVSAGGVKFDQMMTNDGENQDNSWDPNWWVVTSINSEGWIAEMKIPFSQLRFEKNSGEVWGLEVLRTIYRKAETCVWQHIPQDAPGIVHMLGEMAGVEKVRPRKIFDVTPYGVAQLDKYPPAEGNPFETGKRTKLNAGLDAKIGVTNNLTMDLTINPDFGQVEADPSEVNLTAYETFFKEKRPFFIEGNNIINFGLGIGDGTEGNDNLFYSRRIGRKPQIEPDPVYGSNEGQTGYSQSPDRTSILGAAKLTGKTQNGLSVGFMNAVTSEEMADIDTGGYKTHQVVEPLTNYLAARLQKDYKEGNTIIGGMFTSVNRFMDNIPATEDPDNTIKNTLASAAYSGGLDFTQYFHKKTYMINLNTAFSYIEGTELAMVRAQRSSARYFQKPGNSVSLDSSRTSLSGNGGRLQFMKIGNGHLSYGAAFLWKTPGLELNDMGYLRETDQMLQVLWANYRIWEPKSFYRSININANQYKGWDFSGNNLFDGLNVNGNINFKNYWFAGAGTNLNYNVISNSLLRGGPVMKMPGSLSSWLHINTDSRKKLQINIGVQHTLTFEGSGHNLNIQPEITYKPLNALSLSLSPTYMLSYDELQYVDQTYYGSQPRYIYGSIDQKIVGMSFRVNFNLTPDLTLQYWGQPFVAYGKYDNFKYITDPMASEYHGRFAVYSPDQLKDDGEGGYAIDENVDGTVDYSIGKPDFNFRQFLSNLVIRWEYNPGSSIYLVWSQTRTNSDYTGTMDYSNDLDYLFSTKPYNVFLIKFSYRFGLR